MVVKTMMKYTSNRIWQALDDVKDPEIPTISVVEMGMIGDVRVESDSAEVEVMPTFVGCPALEMIQQNIKSRLLLEEGIERVGVRFVFDPPWTSDRITATGREKLKKFGIAPPVPEGITLPECPYCGSEKGRVENLFGPTACRAICYCCTCHQPFEAMKTI